MIFSGPEILPGRTDVTSDKVNFRAKIRKTFFYIPYMYTHRYTYTCFRKCGWRKYSSPQRPQIYIYIYIFIYIYIYKFVRTKVLVKYFFVCVFFETKNIYSYTHSAYAGGQVIEKVSPRWFPETDYFFFGLQLIDKYFPSSSKRHKIF